MNNDVLWKKYISERIHEILEWVNQVNWIYVICDRNLLVYEHLHQWEYELMLYMNIYFVWLNWNDICVID